MIFTARQMQEKCYEQYMDLVQFMDLVIDLTKSFDTVNRALLWKILGKIRCPDHFVSTIKSFRDGMEVWVNVGGGMAGPIPVENVVKQGDVLVPTLFSLYFAAVFVHTFAKWDLVCNKEGLAESTQIFYIVGQMISGLISPYLIERFGRKPVRVSSSALLIIFNLFGAFSPFYYLFAAMRFFIGILREESVRWLIATSKMKAAEKIVKKAAKQNKVDFDTIWHITLKDTSTSTQQTASPVNETNLDGRNCESNVEANAKAVVNQSQLEVEKQAPMLEKLIVIFKSPYLRKVTIVMSIVWAVDLTSSNSIMLMSEAFGESVYIVYPTICLLEILTNSLYAFSAKRSAGTGFATIFIRIVGLSSPYFRLLILNIPWAPGVIIGTGCIISSILLHIYLPETGNRALPQKIEDVI
ncbi:solute carrier family 22 member 8-like [Octopus vulgaris]|uniref:Solute carrier family 22 member 8-like n=1 Tax=Octopus vulgaris TaxID=6645 RepID=A0AA36FAQ2_OCTVU|nr:solute carrier family 22 member 8-like [Octopus vulgaris]